MINIRNVTSDDARELLDIYAPYIEKTAITFEYDIPTLDEFRERISQISNYYPYLVASDNGRIIGYAYASEFKARAAYQWSVETSIYLDMKERHHGVGKTLYTELEKQLNSKGILNMNACITYMDEADEYLQLDSINFHETMGLARSAHFHQIREQSYRL